MIRRPPRSTRVRSSAASDVYKRQVNKLAKADHLKKLAEVYEVLRAARMPKLEAVRLALMNESMQLRGL